MYCSKLEEVHIPKNVSNINYNAFFSCRSLHDVYVYNPVPYYINWCVFKNISDNSTLHVPYGVKDLYVGSDNANKLPGTIYSINEWYNRWHDGSSQGTCKEMGKEAEGQMKVQLMRTSLLHSVKEEKSLDRQSGLVIHTKYYQPFLLQYHIRCGNCVLWYHMQKKDKIKKNMYMGQQIMQIIHSI